MADFSSEDRYLLNLYHKLPIKAWKGSGVYLYDTENKRYLDFMAGYGVAILGHCHPRLVRAISEQAKRLITTHSSLYCEARERFLNAFMKISPSTLDHIYLCNSGAEAVEASLKFARKITGRKGFIAFTGSYHGKTFGALSVTSNEKYRRFFEPLIGPVYFGEYGNLDSLQKLPFSHAAAAIVEPVQGESGVRLPSSDFMKELEDKCKKSGCLFIVDEIQSGLGRTGRVWAHQSYGIKPDIMTVAKGLAGGIPMGATLVTKEIANRIEPGDQSTTFGGNPLACAAGVVIAEMLSEPNFLNNVSRVAEELRRKLSKLSTYKIFRELRIAGLMIGIELRIRFNQVLIEALHNGLLTLYSGRNTIRMLPPLIIKSKDVESCFAILDKTFQKVEEKMFRS